MVELGDLYGEETRKLLLKFKVPAMAALGLAQIASLELAYVELPGLVEQVVSLPISVNVVPGDVAAGRVPHPTVHTELLFQEAQDIKKQASEAFERHDLEAGKRLLGSTVDRLSESLAAAPEELKPDIRAELDFVARMDAMTDRAGSAYMSKTSYQSHHHMNRKRGRAFRQEDEADPER
jgi:Ca-activated chloride channel family protein